MRHTMTLFVASRAVNGLMEQFDLRPLYKWFVKPVTVTFNTTEAVSDKYFHDLIEKSKGDRDYWIPVVRYMDNWYCDKDVKIISTGEHEMFITPHHEKSEAKK